MGYNVAAVVPVAKSHAAYDAVDALSRLVHLDYVAGEVRRRDVQSRRFSQRRTHDLR